jgi:Putative Ig domain
MGPGLDEVGSRAFRSTVLRRAIVAFAAAVMLGVQAGAAAATGAFQQSATSITLPPGVQNGFWDISGTACGSTYCASVGSYLDSFGDEPLAVLGSSGAPTGGVQVQLPSGGQPNSLINGVSCWSAGSCVGVGAYVDASGDSQSLVVPITDGSVGTGIQVPPPQNATASQFAGGLGSVSCSASGTCIAVGSYADSSGNTVPFVVPITNGTVGTAVEAPLPSGAVGSGTAQLTDVSCPTSSASCVAIGYWVDPDQDFIPFTESITNGVPSDPVSVPLPADGDITADNGLRGVSCWAAGACVAVGYYEDDTTTTTTPGYRGLVVPIANGSPQPAVEVDAPGGFDQDQLLGGVACQSSGDCLAVGDYFVSGPGVAETVTITNGSVGAAANVALPSNAVANGLPSQLSGVSCPPSGACLAVGGYTDTANQGDGLIVPFDGGTVGSGTEAPAPTIGPTAPPSASLYTVACGGSGSCIATGVELDQSNQEFPYLVSAQVPISIATTGLPGDAVGLRYQASLSATGAWNSYFWSVSAGQLPAGLTLNAQTGEISGAPTTPGTATFTVMATGAGNPIQTATQQLSVAVAASRLQLVTKSAVARKNRVALSFSCSVGDCRGTAKLETVEAVTVEHGKKRLRRHLTVTIGSAPFSIPVGTTGTVDVSLNGAGRKLLASHRKLSVTVIAKMTGVKPTVGHLTLKAPAVKHKKTR